MASAKDELIYAAGRTFWWEFCTPVNTILLYARDEFDKVANHPKAQQHLGKKYLKKCIAECNAYSSRLYHGGDFGTFNMFSLKCKMKEEQSWYREDVTSEELFDYWRTIGCEGYLQILPFYTCLENKVRQMIIKNDTSYNEEASGLINVCYLATAFNFILKRSVHQLEVQARYRFENEFANYSMKPLAHLCDRLGAAVFGSAHLMMEELMVNNISHGITDILDRWSDYRTPMRNAMIVTTDFPELFRTKGYMMKQIDDYAKMIDEIENEAEKYRQRHAKESKAKA